MHAKRSALLIAALIALIVPSAASGENLAPTLSELAHAEHVARSYWHGNPSCGTPSVAEGVIPAAEEAQASYDICRVELNAANDWRDFPALVCKTVVHEWGHLVLGPTYFAAVNPTNPAHSPDMRSIMAPVLPDRFAPCEPSHRSGKHHVRR